MKEGEEEGELLGSRLLFRQLKHPKKNSKGGSVYVRKLRSSMYYCFESLTLDPWPLVSCERYQEEREGVSRKVSYQSGLRFSSERRQNQAECEAGVMRAAEEIGARNTRTG